MDVNVQKIINSVVFVAIVIVIYLIFARVLRMVFRRLDRKGLKSKQGHKMWTLSQMIMSALRYILLLLTVLVVLANMGVNVSSLLAGLGIFTVVFGLAFQDMIKDVIAGVTIIAEDQFGVGDDVEISGFRGIVSSVGLKTTEITGKSGQVKIVSNRNMDGLVNYSKAERDKEPEKK